LKGARAKDAKRAKEEGLGGGQRRIFAIGWSGDPALGRLTLGQRRYNPTSRR
jgi:hypothetical protein